MTNRNYLDMIMSLFDNKKQSYILSLASYHNNELDTVLLAYTFYKYNFLPYCVAVGIKGEVMISTVQEPETTIQDVNIDDIIVSNECCIYVDRIVSFMSNKAIKTSKKERQDLNCQYMAYLFLVDKTFNAYELFKKCLSQNNHSYALSTLENTLLTAYKLPSNPNFTKYGKFLTNPFANNLGSCIGRDKEIVELVDVLSRKKKNNAILVGQPGVGKTAIVEGFANLLMSSKCPKQFQGYHIYEVSISSLLAGAKYRGDFEERLEGILTAISESDVKIILFIDEIHNIMVNNKDNESSGTGMSAADILKPYMAREGFLLIGATTETEYHIIEKDSALNRRFSVVRIKEPDNSTVQYLLEHSIDDYQNHFNLSITKTIIPEIIKYANTYIVDRYMPDKALDLLDESCVYCVNHTDKTNLEISDIICATEALTGVKVPSEGPQTSNKITDILEHISEVIVGQHEAVESVSSVIKRYFLGLTSTDKPIGSFLFAGPTGVGKTQLCKELAYSMFTRESFIRFDMSEYMEAHAVAKLIGSPPGYVGYGSGGKLTNAVKNNPYSVVLFDEIEKAHEDIYSILLQILDEGCLTDSEGFKVNFKNCIIILTSNIGVRDVSEKSKSTIGFGDIGFTDNDRQKLYENAVKKKFAPEFINRLDKIVYFNSLTYEDIKILVDRELKQLMDKFKKRNIKLDISTSVKNSLYTKCFSPDYGARYAKRLVVTELEDMIVDYLIDNELSSLDKQLKISIRKKDNTFICQNESLALI